MNDAKIENVEAMIEFTRDYGVYSQGSGSSPSLENVKKADGRPQAPVYKFKEQKRTPGVCLPWEQKRKEFAPVVEREELARNIWESVDGLGYGFLWVNLTW